MKSILHIYKTKTIFPYYNKMLNSVYNENSVHNNKNQFHHGMNKTLIWISTFRILLKVFIMKHPMSWALLYEMYTE